MNLGLISMLAHDYAKANEQIGAAAGVPESADAMGVYYLSQGDVQKAINSFGDAKTNNAALAHILARHYTTAQEILAKVAAPDATFLPEGDCRSPHQQRKWRAQQSPRRRQG